MLIASDRGNGNLVHGGALEVLQRVLVGVVMHGYVGLGKGERLGADGLQAGRRAGPGRRAAVVDAVVGLDAGVDGRRRARRPRSARAHGPRAAGAVPRVAGPAGLVHQPPLGLGRQHVGRVGLVVGGLVAVDLQAALAHRVQASLVLAAEAAQRRPLDAAEHAATEARAVARVHEGVDARLEEEEHEAAQLELVMREGALGRQHVLRQRHSHRQTAEQHGEDYNHARDNCLGVFGRGQVDCGHHLTARRPWGRTWNQTLAASVGIGVRLHILQLVVRLVAVQRGALNRALHALEARRDEGRRGWGARGVHRDDGTFPHSRVLPQRLSDGQVGHGHHGHAESKVGQVDVQHHPGVAASQAKVGQAGPVPARVRSHGEERRHGEAGRPQQGGERQRAGEGRGAVGLLPQNHAQPVQGDDRYRLQRHDDEARAGQVEGEAETLGHAVPSARVQEEHQREHGGGHAADEQVAEGQVEDHEVKVGAELAERRVKKGQEHHQVAVGAQAEDEDEEEGAKGQGGGVDHGPARRGLRAQAAIQRLMSRHVHQVRR